MPDRSIPDPAHSRQVTFLSAARLPPVWRTLSSDLQRSGSSRTAAVTRLFHLFLLPLIWHPGRQARLVPKTGSLFVPSGEGTVRFDIEAPLISAILKCALQSSLVSRRGASGSFLLPSALISDHARQLDGRAVVRWYREATSDRFDMLRPTGSKDARFRWVFSLERRQASASPQPLASAPSGLSPAADVPGPVFALTTPTELIALEMEVRKFLTERLGLFDLYDNISVSPKGDSLDIRDIRGSEAAARIRELLDSNFPEYLVVHQRVTVEDRGDQEFVRLYPKKA